MAPIPAAPRSLRFAKGAHLVVRLELPEALGRRS